MEYCFFVFSGEVNILGRRKVFGFYGFLQMEYKRNKSAPFLFYAVFADFSGPYPLDMNSKVKYVNNYCKPEISVTEVISRCCVCSNPAPGGSETPIDEEL